MAMNVDGLHPQVSKYEKHWRKVRDATAGESAIHDAGVRYLPKLKDESQADYKARVGRTSWYNATWRTLSGLHGMLFRKDPVIEAPAGVKALLDDVTLTGVPFINFIKELGHEVLGPGLAGVLVDHPPAPDTGDTPLTVAMAEQLGLRPTMALYKCEAFVNWKFRRIRNKWVLSQMRLKETVSEDKDEFTSKDVDQIRVLDLNPEAGDTYRIRVYRKSENTGKWEQFGPDVVPLMGNKPLDFIPFMFVTANGIVAELDEPPMIDLVDLNLKHYQVTADYEHACHFTGLPTPYVTGLQAKVDPKSGEEIPHKIYVGSTSFLIFSNADAQVGYLEFEGKGLDALKENLERKEAQMAAVGARMLAPEKKGVEAGETLAMRHAGENSVLSAIGNSLSHAASQALAWFSLWASANGKAEVRLNRDFMAMKLDGATLTSLVQSWQSGAISEQELFDEMQRGDLIDPDKTFEQHKAEIEANPPMGVLAAQAGIDALKEEPEEEEEEE